jgi:hypothetical protein
MSYGKLGRRIKPTDGGDFIWTLKKRYLLVVDELQTRLAEMMVNGFHKGLCGVSAS